MGSAQSMATEGRRRLSLSPTAVVLLIGVICALVLALPGVTVTTKSLDELFLLLDGIHHIVTGQVPSRDFSTALGPLAFYGPATGFALTGSLGAAMPVAMALFTAMLALIASHVLVSRLHPFLAIAFAAFLLLILAAPMNLGDAVTALSFAMFYNRIGWVALALLLVLYLPPHRMARGSILLDAAAAAALTLIMVYLRVTYGIVALGFLLFMTTDRRQQRWVALAIALTALVLLAVELLWGGTSTYLQDSWQAMRETSADYLQLGVAHLADFLLLSLLAGLGLWRRWSVRDFVFFIFCGAAGLWLLSQNVQGWGIISIHAAAAVAAQRLLQQMDEGSEAYEGAFVNRSGVKLFFLAFVLPTALHCAMALALHAGAATVRAGQALELPRLSGIRLADLWTGGDFGGGRWYLSTVEDGLSLLARQDKPIGRLAVVGAVDAFSPVLDLPPGDGDGGGVVDLRWSGMEAVSPQRALAGAETILFRNPGDTPVGAAALYLDFAARNFSRVGESQHWILFRRNQPTAVPE
ncbi:MAG: hypothetical protein KJ947_00345 [Alphaproteobacteria bacterium]|nr:hypothetical protein [Alphaproteobacteria bacterium]MBU1548005.1 hypothetical protein [Alphaproteobacteria bacterium]MBU2336233.1 hypothetical protein [Alphaproteobacteria bacterium]MBU2390372.1 hypothetical protein [Alphaproteobacteria bacterium]